MALLNRQEPRGFLVPGRTSRPKGTRLLPLVVLSTQNYLEGFTYEMLLLASGYTVGAFGGSFYQAVGADYFEVIGSYRPPIGAPKRWYAPTTRAEEAADQLIKAGYTLAVTADGEIVLEESDSQLDGQ